jgi:hypothetical protein
MDIELVAKEMRERALLLEANPTYTFKELQGIKLSKAKAEQIERVENLK